MKKTEIPASAYQFRAKPAKIESAEGSSGPRRFRGIAYSGLPMSHPWWGVVVIDLSSTAAKEQTPALIDHDRAQRAGFAKLEISEGGIEVAEGTLLSNAHGQAVAADSDDGFPWEMSVHVEPGSVEELKAGAKATVNGREISGPASIFRNNRIREVSFTPTGVDDQTSAAAMSLGAKQRADDESSEEQRMNDLEQAQQEIKDLKASVEALEKRAEESDKRAQDAEAALQARNSEVRLSQVKEMFSATGREFTEEAAKPYLGMDDATFSAVRADLESSAKAKAAENGHLFSAQADNGQAPDGDGALIKSMAAL
jgi:hypothetical protein